MIPQEEEGTSSGSKSAISSCRKRQPAVVTEDTSPVVLPTLPIKVEPKKKQSRKADGPNSAQQRKEGASISDAPAERFHQVPEAERASGKADPKAKRQRKPNIARGEPRIEPVASSQTADRTSKSASSSSSAAGKQVQQPSAAEEYGACVASKKGDRKRSFETALHFSAPPREEANRKDAVNDTSPIGVSVGPLPTPALGANRLSLRERLANRCVPTPPQTQHQPAADVPSRLGSGLLDAAQSSKAGTVDEKSVDHSALGGLTLQWRLLLDSKTKRRKSMPSTLPSAADAAAEEDVSCDNGSAVARMPRRSKGGETRPRSRSRSQTRPSVTAGFDELPTSLPATPPHTEVKGRLTTPTPPSSQRSAGHEARVAARKADGRKSDPGCGPHGAGKERVDGQVRGEIGSLNCESMASTSVSELKAALAARGVNYAGCVEKADLLALWLRAKSGSKLGVGAPSTQATATSSPFLEHQSRFRRASSVSPQQQVDDATRPPRRSLSSPPLQVNRRGPNDTTPPDSGQQGRANREQHARKEVDRILALRPNSFPNAAAWGYAILNVSAKEAVMSQGTAATRGYRNLMKQLHPDKIEQSPMVSKAVDLVREARDAVERSLLRVQPPAKPRQFQARLVNDRLGQRRLCLAWKPPLEQDGAPVARYIVAVVDPSYGRALAVATLEPDYNQELGRFLPIEELTQYVLEEVELRKMPRFWQQVKATVQVAAGNDAGQSGWAVCQAQLRR